MPPELAKRINSPALVLDPWNVLAFYCVLNWFIPLLLFFSLFNSSPFHTLCVRPLCRFCSATVALGHVFFFFFPIVHIRQPHPTNLTILTTTTTTTPTKKQTGLIQSLPCLAWLISSFSPLFWPLPPLLPPPTPANPPCLTNP